MVNRKLLSLVRDKPSEEGATSQAVPKPRLTTCAQLSWAAVLSLSLWEIRDDAHVFPIVSGCLPAQPGSPMRGLASASHAGRRCCASIRSLKLCAALERLLNRPVKLISFFFGGSGRGGGRRKSRGSDSGLLRPGLCVSLAKSAVAPELPASQRRLELGLCMGEGARTDSPAGWWSSAELFAVWEFTPSVSRNRNTPSEWSKACSAFVARDFLADSGIAPDAITSFAWLRAVSHRGVCAIGGSPKLPSWPPA